MRIFGVFFVIFAFAFGFASFFFFFCVLEKSFGPNVKKKLKKKDMGEVAYEDKVVLKSERDHTRKPSQFNYFYHGDDVLPWVEFLDSENFRRIAATEKENLEFDFSDEKRQKEIIKKRAKKHCQEIVEEDGEDLEWAFFNAVIPVLYPGDDVQVRAKELRLVFFFLLLFLLLFFFLLLLFFFSFLFSSFNLIFLRLTNFFFC